MSVFEQLSAALADEFPAEAARVLEGFGPGEVARVLRDLDTPAAAGVLAALSQRFAVEVIHALDDELSAQLLGEIEPRHSAALLRRCGDRAEPILHAMSRDAQGARRRLLTYPASTAGAVMDPSVAALAAGARVGTALEMFRSYASRRQHYLYVTDAEGRLVGSVRPVDLALADADARLDVIAAHGVPRLRDHDDLVTIATHDGWNDWRSLPVVDRDGVFLGEVRHREVRRMVAEQAGSRPTSTFSLPISLAELCWLGLTGFTDGLAHVVTRQEETDGR